ncbi:MAG: hypothetical protein K2K72_06180, partial [Duncaniella sp.]|nr:hypothetical protein [Duncaniella sp.]
YQLGGEIQNIGYGPDDMPIVLRLRDAGEDQEIKIPVVYLGDEKLEYDPELNGFRLPDPLPEHPNLKIFDGQPYYSYVSIVSPEGVTFNVERDGEAIGDYETSAIVNAFPGSQIRVKAKAADGSTLVVYADDDNVVTEGAQIDYSFMMTKTPVSELIIDRKKMTVTINADTDYDKITVRYGNDTMVLGQASVSLELPATSTELALILDLEGKRIQRVIDALTGDDLAFDAATGVLSGLRDGMTASVVIGDYLRDNSLTVYLEEESSVLKDVRLVLGDGTVNRKEISVQEGYQQIMYHAEDVPMALMVADGNPAVYLDGELQESADGTYLLPADLHEGSVLRLYAEEQPHVSVSYSLVNLSGYSVSVRHDDDSDIDLSASHKLMPGVGIRLMVTPVMSLAAMPRVASRAGVVQPYVLLNEEELTPQPDGSYFVKVRKEHAEKGLNFSVGLPDVSSGIDEMAEEEGTFTVYDLRGVLIVRDASREELKALAPGVYIINGQKILVR